MVSQVRRAALSVKLNLAEGSSRKSKVERNRFYEIARGSVVEIDAAAEVMLDLEFLTPDNIELLGELLNRCFSMLSKLIN
ncbi:four helix bundle protein [Ferruginibacter albus]|uniref:four helix bundle protein n=1 Tax=Ferruginibacter albus TaxID=2875540 RepID=UPI002101E26D|nr:four helix bundle protein [Ferruginibacter albus]